MTKGMTRRGLLGAQGLQRRAGVPGESRDIRESEPEGVVDERGSV